MLSYIIISLFLKSIVNPNQKKTSGQFMSCFTGRFVIYDSWIQDLVSEVKITKKVPIVFQKYLVSWLPECECFDQKRLTQHSIKIYIKFSKILLGKSYYLKRYIHPWVHKLFKQTLFLVKSDLKNWNLWNDISVTIFPVSWILLIKLLLWRQEKNTL